MKYVGREMSAILITLHKNKYGFSASYVKVFSLYIRSGNFINISIWEKS